MFLTHCIESSILAWLYEYSIAQFSNFELFPLEQFSCKPIDGQGAQFALNWIGFHLILQFLSESQILYVLFINYLTTFVYKNMQLSSYACSVTNVMQDSLVHSSSMRVKSVSSSAVLSFCRDALGSFDKWLRAAAISITTFFCPPPSGFQVVGFSFWDFPNKWGGWRPRKTNNKASEILTSDSSMRKLRSQAIACKMTVVNRPPIMLKYNFSCSFLWSKNWFIQDIRVL